MHVVRLLTLDPPRLEDLGHAGISRILAAIQQLYPVHIAAVISEILDIFDNWENSSGAMSICLLKFLPNALAAANGAEEGNSVYEDGAKAFIARPACFIAWPACYGMVMEV